MKGQPHTWNFETEDQLERWFADFQQKANAICKRYNVPHVFQHLKYFRGETAFSIQVHVPPTSNKNEEHAVDDIINLVNSEDF